MYCYSCGAAVDDGLTYCNRCGTKLRRTVVGLRVTSKDVDDSRRADTSQLSPNFLVAAIVWTFVGGLGAIIGLMAVMKKVPDFNPGLFNAFTLLSFLLLVSTEALLATLLFRRTGSGKVPGKTSPIGESASNEAVDDDARALPPPPVSVTEHTTRTIDSAYVERISESEPER